MIEALRRPRAIGSAAALPLLLACASLHPPSTLARAGAVAVPITPGVSPEGPPVWLAGYGPGRRASGVHDPLFARAFVWDDGERALALVALDLVGLFHDRVEAVRRRVAARPELARAEVIVASTHNHEGPDSMGLWGASPTRSGADPAYLEFVEDRIVEAIERAAAGARPATLWAGEARTESLVHDSRLPIVKDEEVRVLEAREEASGKPIASVLLFSSHPEALGSGNTLVSADYPGYALRAVERERGSVGVFLAGSIGGLLGPGPIRVPDPETGEPAPADSFRNAELYGEALAWFAVRALEGAERVEDPRVRFERRSFEVPVENSLYLLAARLGVVRRDDLLVSGRRPEDPAEFVEGPVSLRTEVGRLRIGEVDWLLVPGEIYPEIVFGGIVDPPDPGADFPDAPLEPGLFPLLRGRHRGVVGLANDEIGYLIPKRQWDFKPPFAFGRKGPQYGEVNSCGPEAGPSVAAAAAALLRGR